MKNLIRILIFCFVLAWYCPAEAEDAGPDSKYAYLYTPQGEIKGFESEDYMFSMEGEILGYKVRDDKYVYIYSPKGDMLGYRKRVRTADYQYLYDSQGNVIGYYSGTGPATPFLKSADPLKEEVQ